MIGVPPGHLRGFAPARRGVRWLRLSAISEPVVRVHSSPKRQLAVKATRSTGATQMTVPQPLKSVDLLGTASDLGAQSICSDSEVSTHWELWLNNRARPATRSWR